MLKAVLIDSREPKNVQEMDFGAPSAVTTLDTGDLWAATDDDYILIERKSAGDLLNSIADKRLFNQMMNMHKRATRCYLVVCEPLIPTTDGYLEFAARDTRWNWGAVQGALLTVQEMGIGVVTLTGLDDYPAAVERLAKRKREVKIAPRVKENILTPGEAILSALPGIGFERAQLVADEFDHNIGEALAWLTWQNDSVFKIPGIGEITKGNIRRALGMRDGQELYCLQEGEREYWTSQLNTRSSTDDHGRELSSAGVDTVMSR